MASKWIPSCVSKKVRCVGPHQWHDMHYREWKLVQDGNSSVHFSPKTDKPKTLICVHGLTRNSTDFNEISKLILTSPGNIYEKIICPDIVGRGGSDWLFDKKGTCVLSGRHLQDYNYGQYQYDMGSLIASITENGEQVDFLGTSMGGLLGMFLSALPKNPIRKLVVNDISLYVSKESLKKIATYCGKAPKFNSMKEATDYFKQIHKSFGITQEEEWNVFTENSVRKCVENGVETGQYEVLYDPQITVGHGISDMEKINDVELWFLYDLIKIPVMLIRGKESELLSLESVEVMKKRGPGLSAFVEFPGCGHAPMLNTPEQVKPITDFLFA